MRREKEKRGRVEVRVFSDSDREEESSREVGEVDLFFSFRLKFVVLGLSFFSLFLDYLMNKALRWLLLN